MPAAEAQFADTELERVERWRARMLEQAGYDSRQAQLLATRHDIDVHRAIELLERGCPAQVALRILL